MSAKVSKDERSRQTEYRELCEHFGLPLHFQPWWLDAVCGGPGGWGACLARDRGGAPTGVLPWYRHRRWGLPLVQMPPLTSYAGPWYFYPQNAGFKEVGRLAFEKKTAAALIGQLPRSLFFRQHFRPEIGNWLPFYWAGFKQSTRYTYRLDPALHTEAARENTLRTDLKKAQAALEIFSADAQAECLFDLYRQSLRRQGLPAPPREPVFQALYRALSERGQSLVLLARERGSGAPVAGIWLAFDRREAALLLSGATDAGRRLAATPALIDAAIGFCREKNLVLDFEGSMHEGMERLFRAFGGQLTPYFRVWR
ncbi:MAG: GNAT family N-acetyltransferase [Saprospiraceae bacterium]|nr:GNAT family N-acetyltransferase [Saprospiraceae bacterium]